MKEMTFNFTVDEANLILEGLGDMPFNKVYALIAKIQEQAGQQVSEQQSSPDSSEEVIDLAQTQALKDAGNG